MMKKRIVCMALAFILLVGMMPTVVLAANGDFAGGTGTKSDPYLIETKAQLNAVRKYLFAHYKLQNDLVFTKADFKSGGAFYNGSEGFQPIGTAMYPFTGSFDGNGHSIQNLYINLDKTKTFDEEHSWLEIGVFGYNRGTIENLSVVDGEFIVWFGEGLSLGSIVGSNFGQVKNCYSANSISAVGTRIWEMKVGGIVGYNKGTVSDCRSNCEIYAESRTRDSGLLATTTMNVGGIAGQNEEYSEIINSHNTGAVTCRVQEYADARVGGIVGKTRLDEVRDCSNRGDITISTGYNDLFDSYADIKAGGIGGEVFARKPMENCYNSGTLSVSTEYECVLGGICGEQYKSSIKNCHNDGDVSLQMLSTTNHRKRPAIVGGVVGHAHIAVDYCSNSGTISANTRGFNYLAGVIGYSSQSITNCFNTGALVSNKAAYGIASTFGGQMSNCYNSGNVSAPFAIGVVSNCGYPLKNCYNVGKITGENCTGIVYTNSAVMSNCYNAGEVVGTKNAAAIAMKNQNQIQNCYYLDSLEHGTAEGTDTAVKCTAQQLAEQTTYGGFDFDNLWGWNTAVQDYPTLRVFCYHDQVGDCAADPCDLCTGFNDRRHTYGAFVSNGDATTEISGTKTRTCSACGATETILDKGSKANPFDDVTFMNYYYKPVLWGMENNVVAGVTERQFAPEESCTRGQIVSLLWRAVGSPKPTSTKMPFTDVNKSKYYYKAVLWASERNIAAGITKTKFAPGNICTRGQIVTFLWRAEGQPKVSVAKQPFTDVKKSDYCYKAVLWATKCGITSGVSKTKFAPSDVCNRGQAIAFLHRNYK